MLKKKTCLLLGAGASKHLEFPLGDELRQQMLGVLRAEKTKPVDKLPEEFKKSGEDISLFYDRLAYGNWTSPDAFLEKHREFIKTGKYLICRCLADLENSAKIVTSGGWYDKLVSAIHVDYVNQLKDNQLSVVTFNYDRSLDFRLHKYVENQFGIESGEAWKMLNEAIPIVHVHGTLGKYPDWGYGDKSQYFERGQDIMIVSEVEDDTDEFRLASKLLKEADRVIVFGFGFGTDNVRRLKFFKTAGEVEDRELIIATGPNRGTVPSQETTEWLSQWGLEQKKHHWDMDCNTFLNYVSNPFR